MKYRGMIMGSRTLDALGLFTVLSALQMPLMDVLKEFNASPKWVVLVNFIMIAVLAFLRFQTTTAVGEK
jgi:hypothetical protein